MFQHPMLVIAAGASIGRLAAVSTAAASVVGALVGLVFRGAAAAWREERDAAVEKADRLEAKVGEQEGQIRTLEKKVELLEKRTDYDSMTDRNGREHERIISALEELTRGLHVNTTAVEFLIKQAFPETPFGHRAAGT